MDKIKKIINLWIHKVVAIPAIYDLSQQVAGRHITQKILRQELTLLPNWGSVLDVGGGTGFMRNFLQKTWEYTCLDNDPQKLNTFQRKNPRDNILLASATQIPKPNDTYDLCILSAVSHHLESLELESALEEIFRVLKPSGQFIFLDAVFEKNNIGGKILWALDRGGFPRTLDNLKYNIEKRFVISRSKNWKVIHQYALLLCHKKTNCGYRH